MKKYIALSGYFKENEIMPISVVERKEWWYEYQQEDIIFGVKIPDKVRFFFYKEMVSELILCYEKYQKRGQRNLKLGKQESEK